MQLGARVLVGFSLWRGWWGSSRRGQTRQPENRQQRALRQWIVSVVRYGNRPTIGVCPDEMTAAGAIVPKVGCLQDAFHLSVGQGFHRATFSPRPKSMPSVTSTRYRRSSASLPPSVKHSGCPRTSARYRSPSCVTSATKCSPCVSNRSLLTANANYITKQKPTVND